MGYFGLFNDDGTPKGFLHDSVNEKISEAVALTDKQWAELVNNQDTRRYINGKVVKVERGLLELTPQNLAAYAAEKRWKVETGGIEFDGMKIATDRESQSMIGNAVQITSMTGQPIKFKAENGFIELTSEQMQGVALAIASHVQAAFVAESGIISGINMGRITTTAQIDAYAWPGSAVFSSAPISE